jgi:hypothetical protein
MPLFGPPGVPAPVRLARELIRRGLLDESDHIRDILARVDRLDGWLARALVTTDDAGEVASLKALGQYATEARQYAALGQWQGAQEAYEVLEYWFLSETADRAATTEKKRAKQRVTATQKGHEIRKRSAKSRGARYANAARRMLEKAERRGFPRSLNDVAEHLRRQPPRGARRVSIRQMFRYFSEAGLTEPRNGGPDQDGAKKL